MSTLTITTDARTLTFTGSTRANALDAFDTYLDKLADAIRRGTPADLIGGATIDTLNALCEILEEVDRVFGQTGKVTDATLSGGRSARFSN